jgi:O-methyltransferase involved in polyketide biosynthesis
MDSRVFWVDPPASVSRFDVDYPDVIDLRRQLLPARHGHDYHLIGAPLEDLRWLDEVPRDRPGLLIAEGGVALPARAWANLAGVLLASTNPP